MVDTDDAADTSMIDTSDAYLMGFRIIEVLSDYELCSAFENGIRNGAHQRSGLMKVEKELLKFIKNMTDSMFRLDE